MQKINKTESYRPRNKEEKFLIKTIASIKSEEEAANFLRDLLTLAEIEEFSNRLKIARLLLEEHSYKEIADICKTSTTTVTRVAHWLFNGCGGYYNLLKKFHNKKLKRAEV